MSLKMQAAGRKQKHMQVNKPGAPQLNSHTFKNTTEGVMSRKSLYQFGFSAAILSALSWFVYILVSGFGFLPDLASIENAAGFFEALNAARTSYLVFGWSGVFGTVFFLTCLVTYYQALRSRNPEVLLAFVFSIIGASLAIIGFSKPLMAIYTFLPIGLEASPETVAMVKQVTDIAKEVVEFAWNYGSFLIFGVGSFMLAFAAYCTKISANWANLLGIIGGLAGIVWLDAYIPGFGGWFSTILILINILFLTIWTITISAYLVRHDTAKAHS